MFGEIHNPSHEEVLARRARLGLAQKPKPILKLVPPAPEPVAAIASVEDEGYVTLNMLLVPSWRFLLGYVCLKHGTTPKEVLSPLRTPKILTTRYEAVSLVFTHQRRSMPDIGKLFNRDHTSILAILRKTRTISNPRPTAPKEAKPDRSKLAKSKTTLQKAIQRGYASGISALDIAEAYGASVKSIHVIAHRLGLEHPNYRRSK